MGKYRFSSIVSFIFVAGAAAGIAQSAEAQSSHENSSTASKIKGTKPDANPKAPGVRDHLHLQPVTAAQFKTASTQNKKPSAPGARDHLNLQPLTADDFKTGAKVSKKPPTESSAAK